MGHPRGQGLRISGLLLTTVLAVAGFQTPAAAGGRDALTLAIGGEPETGFDPVLGWGAYGNPLFQSTLLRRDAALEIQPDLATDWQLSDDRKTWTITLRDDVRFSDGTPLTARDVAFTFNTAKAAAGAVDLEVMEQAEALDDRTVRITLSRPWITFTENLLTLGIVLERAYGPDYARAPIGSGPYRFLSWNEGEQLIVERNEHYYGTPGAFQRITFLFTGEDAGLAAAQAGAVDMVAVPAALADAVPDGFHALAVKTVDNRGLSLPFPEPREEGGRRIGNAVTSDPAIRRAMNLGIDRDVVVEVALLGHGTPAFGRSTASSGRDRTTRWHTIPRPPPPCWTPPAGSRGRMACGSRTGCGRSFRSTTRRATRPGRRWRKPRPSCCARSASMRRRAAAAGTRSAG